MSLLIDPCARAEMADSRPPQSLPVRKRGLRRASRLRVGAGFAVGSALIAAALSIARPPLPQYHDEFSYLLLADTLAHGRLANPPHPLWRHFESFHILQQPTYASMYQVAHGLFLAIGVRLGGHPEIGNWILVGLSIAAAYWMLLGWFAGRWAALGAAIIGLHTGIQLGWGQAFWGGLPCFLGACLLYGGFARLRGGLKPAAAVAMALGVALLAESRPYEGLVATLPILAMVVRKMVSAVRSGGARRALVFSAVTASILSPVAGFMLYYNYRVTGDPWCLPYVLNFRTYHATPIFFGPSWLGRHDASHEVPAPVYNHDAMRRFYTEWAHQPFQRGSLLPDLSHGRGVRSLDLAWNFLSTAYLVPLILVGCFTAIRRHSWMLAAIACAVIAELRVPNWLFHYFAAVAPLLLVLAVSGARRLWRSRQAGLRFGRVVVFALLAIYFGDFAVRGITYAASAPRDFPKWRADLTARLESLPGNHLVMVRYGPNHILHEEWVYNGADIDGSKIVWAREMSPSEDRRLFDHFAGYHRWLLTVDGDEPILTEYAPHAPVRSGSGTESERHGRRTIIESVRRPSLLCYQPQG